MSHAKQAARMIRSLTSALLSLEEIPPEAITARTRVCRSVLEDSVGHSQSCCWEFAGIWAAQAFSQPNPLQVCIPFYVSLCRCSSLSNLTHPRALAACLAAGVPEITPGQNVPRPTSPIPASSRGQAVEAGRGHHQICRARASEPEQCSLSSSVSVLCADDRLLVVGRI